MKIKKRIEEKLKQMSFRTCKKLGDMDYHTANKWSDNYTKIMSKLFFEIIPIFSLGFCMLYLFPVHFNMAWDKIIAVILFMILVTINVKKFNKKND